MDAKPLLLELADVFKSSTRDLENCIQERARRHTGKSEDGLQKLLQATWKSALEEADARGDWFVVINCVLDKDAAPRRSCTPCCSALQSVACRGTRLVHGVQTCLFQDEVCATRPGITCDVLKQELGLAAGNDRWIVSAYMVEGRAMGLVLFPRGCNLNETEAWKEAFKYS